MPYPLSTNPKVHQDCSAKRYINGIFAECLTCKINSIIDPDGICFGTPDIFDGETPEWVKYDNAVQFEDPSETPYSNGNAIEDAMSPRRAFIHPRQYWQHPELHRDDCQCHKCTAPQIPAGPAIQGEFSNE